MSKRRAFAVTHNFYFVFSRILHSVSSYKYLLTADVSEIVYLHNRQMTITVSERAHTQSVFVIVIRQVIPLLDKPETHMLHDG